MNKLIEVDNVKKTFHRGTEEVHALGGVSLSIDKGEFVAITGASGSGKSTLLYLIGCMDTVSSGDVRLTGESVANRSEPELAKIRQSKVGFVFQQFFLLPTLTAIENVGLPTLFSKKGGAASALLKSVGLEGRQNHLPRELSGGEMQRVAIARALVNTPELLLADEPTGNLDSQNALSIFELFKALSTERGLTVVVVTHSAQLASLADRVIELKDGRVVGDTKGNQVILGNPTLKGGENA